MPSKIQASPTGFCSDFVINIYYSSYLWVNDKPLSYFKKENNKRIGDFFSIAFPAWGKIR